MAYSDPPAPQDYAQPYGPDTNALIQYLISIGEPGLINLLPSLTPASMDLSLGLAPLGEDLGTTAATNWAEDLIRMSVDPMVGAYGGAGSFAPGAFDPIRTYNPVDLPGARRLTELANSGTNSLEAYIAAALLGDAENAPRTVSQIRADLERLAREYEGKTPEELAAIDPRLADLLPQIPIEEIRDDLGNVTPGGHDWGYVEQIAQELDDLYQSDPTPGTSAAVYGADGELITPKRTLEYVTDENGNQVLVEVTEKPSEQAEHFRDLGIPLPTEEFTPEYLMGEDWQQSADAYQQTWGNDEVIQALIDEDMARRGQAQGAADMLERSPLPGAGRVAERLGERVGDDSYNEQFPGADAIARQLMPYLFPHADQVAAIGRLMPENQLLGGEVPPPDPYGNAVPDSGGVTTGSNALQPTTDRFAAGQAAIMSDADMVNMVKYLMAGQGGDWLSNRQAGLQGTYAPTAPTPNVGPQSTAPPFDQAMLASLVGAANPGAQWTGRPTPGGQADDEGTSTVGSTGWYRQSGEPYPGTTSEAVAGGEQARVVAAIRSMLGIGEPEGGSTWYPNLGWNHPDNPLNSGEPAEQPTGWYPNMGWGAPGSPADPEAQPVSQPTGWYPNLGWLSPEQPSSGGGGGTTAPAEATGQRSDTPWFRRPQEAMLRFIMENAEPIWNAQQTERRGRRRVDEDVAARAAAENKYYDRGLKQRRQVYGYDYGYNLARSAALQRAGITPTSLVLAQRNQVLSQAGLRP